MPVPVLDEGRELFWWDTANYLHMPLHRGGWRPGGSLGLRVRPHTARLPDVHVRRRDHCPGD
ncbi:MAG: hypothetical protein H0X39_13500 [Actinobacteria bacterium]|nr:hypothetical protein [Actinomycetota bacterium]